MLNLNAAQTPPEARQDQTADKVLGALLHLSQSPVALSAREIARGIGKPLSTTYRYLGVLREWDLICENLDGSGYLLGPRCLTLASMFGQHFELGRLALPTLQALSIHTGETALLMIPVAEQIICAEIVESRHPLRYTLQKERTVHSPLHGASAKAMLPYLSEVHLQAALAREPQLPATQLYAEREQIRQRGYAVSEGEVDVGVLAVAAAVLRAPASKPGALIGSISVVAPSFRIGSAQRSSLIREVCAAAAQLGTLVRGVRSLAP